MTLSRRYQSRPPYAYCRVCPEWQDTGSDSPVKCEQEARAHTVVFGHETRAVVTREVIFRPQQSVEVSS